MFGQMLIDGLAQNGVSTQFLKHSHGPSSLAFVTLQNGKPDYTFYTENAADTILHPADAPDPDIPFQALIFGGISLCADPTASIMLELAKARSERSIIMLDPNIRPAFISDETSYRNRLKSMIQCADVIKVSDEDLDWLTGDNTDTTTQLGKLLLGAPKLVLLTKGANGAQAFLGTQHIASAQTPSVPVIDSVGAGDTFNAGFLHALSHNDMLSKDALRALKPDFLQKALTYACKAAAIAVSRKGADPPWPQELDDAPAKFPNGATPQKS